MYFVAVTCELVNHCSDHGACSGPNVCSCYSGFKGANCSEGMYRGLRNRFIVSVADDFEEGPWGPILGKNKGNTQKEENPAGQAKTKTPHLAQALDPSLLIKRS